MRRAVGGRLAARILDARAPIGYNGGVERFGARRIWEDDMAKRSEMVESETSESVKKGSESKNRGERSK